MADPIYVLSASDVVSLQEIIAAHRNRAGNSQTRDSETHRTAGEDHQSANSYIAKVKDGEDPIPALSGIEPGVGECDVYRINQGDTGPELVLTSISKNLVYNYTTSEIGVDDYFMIQRTSQGKWVVIQGGGGNGASIVHFTITKFACDVVDDHGHQYATAEVTFVACGLGDPKVGDEIDVYDLMGCWLDDSEVLLIGRKGIAFKVAHDPGIYGGECTWSVMALCSSGVNC